MVNKYKYFYLYGRKSSILTRLFCLIFKHKFTNVSQGKSVCINCGLWREQ